MTTAATVRQNESAGCVGLHGGACGPRGAADVAELEEAQCAQDADPFVALRRRLEPRRDLVELSEVHRGPGPRQPQLRLGRQQLARQGVQPAPDGHQPALIEERQPVARDEIGRGVLVAGGDRVADGLGDLAVAGEPCGRATVQLDRRAGLLGVQP